jgi:hypothetical protein
LKFELYRFSLKLIWTTLLEITTIIRIATGYEATVTSSVEEEMDYKLARKP